MQDMLQHCDKFIQECANHAANIEIHNAELTEGDPELEQRYITQTRERPKHNTESRRSYEHHNVQERHEMKNVHSKKARRAIKQYNMHEQHEETRTQAKGGGKSERQPRSVIQEPGGIVRDPGTSRSSSKHDIQADRTAEHHSARESRVPEQRFEIYRRDTRADHTSKHRSAQESRVP